MLVGIRDRISPKLCFEVRDIELVPHVRSSLIELLESAAAPKAWDDSIPVAGNPRSTALVAVVKL